jgi:hypothetical protein
MAVVGSSGGFANWALGVALADAELHPTLPPLLLHHSRGPRHETGDRDAAESVRVYFTENGPPGPGRRGLEGPARRKIVERGAMGAKDTIASLPVDRVEVAAEVIRGGARGHARPILSRDGAGLVGRGAS